ncbi:hypothetical protein GCM10011571_03630 [Marinithermofilum abyssi]|uniref:ATP-grasp domain-containing protein n=1 Tax=Marinithermofilum abyssi TaxID=1571185 RepID=A0A8J2VG35_9BACL|nr:YheC/YheD family protein [Marinithermofilum abyssi]GGE05780.1 hypothetical protein GCM10011571_03630 [Marinithermofilum abyssi]
MRPYRQIASKSLKTRVMQKHPVLRLFLPKTVWYSEDALLQMLRMFSVVYIKPDKGGGGAGILRVEKKGERYQASYRRQTRFANEAELIPLLEQGMLPNKRYIIQQGIDVARIDGRPFDLRLLMQKPDQHWIFSGMIAKVAAKGFFVTNRCKGGKPMAVRRALEEVWGKNSPAVQRIMEDCRRISMLTAEVLEQRFPGIRELGLDVGTDRNGRLWIFEVNTAPRFMLFRSIDDPHVYRNIMRRHRSVI